MWKAQCSSYSLPWKKTQCPRDLDLLSIISCKYACLLEQGIIYVFDELSYIKIQQTELQLFQYSERFSPHSSPGRAPRLRISTTNKSPGIAGFPKSSFTAIGPLKWWTHVRSMFFMSSAESLSPICPPVQSIVCSMFRKDWLPYLTLLHFAIKGGCYGIVYLSASWYGVPCLKPC